MSQLHVSLLFICVATASCASTLNRPATSMRGPAMQYVSVTSDPEGARIFLGGKDVGVTPARLLLKRKDANIVLRIERDGYAPKEIALERTINGAANGNYAFALFAVPLPWQGLADKPLTTGHRVAIAIGAPLTGIAVDFMTGAAYKLPAQVAVTLTPCASPPETRTPSSIYMPPRPRPDC